ncbi:MAG TPA: HDIG domain-containing protein [Chthonomonadales bacterium]|nr:HDIG domain-containing protein [Chthonomonadales bacterium]
MAITRETAWSLLAEYTTNESLLKHALAVEAAMRYHAARLGEDPEVWGAVGLVHDFDYERWPTAPDHPTRGMEVLRLRGWPEDLVEAVGSHADYLGIPRSTPMRKALFAVDELCGFLLAVAYVRPSRSLADVGVSSVRKKMKDKAFARAVSRDDIVRGADELGLTVDESIDHCLRALRGAATTLGV